MAKSKEITNKEISDNKETINLLREISDKLSDKKNDRLFQLKLLEFQVRQTNAVSVVTVIVSMSISFLIVYLSLSLSGAIPTGLTNYLGTVIGVMLTLLAIAFIVLFCILHNAMMGKIKKLKAEIIKASDGKT
jgi:uncharacterized Tic20 family protein